jgi:hypothetical protein
LDTPRAASPPSPSPDAIMDDRWEAGIATGARLGLEWTKADAKAMGLTLKEYLARRQAGTLPPRPTTPETPAP